MKKTESIEKDALTEMMSPSVSPSAARDAEVKKSVELALQDYTPKNGIARSPAGFLPEAPLLCSAHNQTAPE